MDKTNVMRILEQKGVPYEGYAYSCTSTEGMAVAASIGKSPEQVFKTLVTVAPTREYFVFVLPVCASLDLKKAAKAVGTKSIEMIKQKELLPLTGYVHGGCSPIGMKKQFVTVVDETAVLYDTIIFSGGKIGFQVEVKPDALAELIGAKFLDITA